MGLSYAVRKREFREEPIDGQFLRAKTYTADFHKYTLKLQNSDGSFSTDWFKSREGRPDPARRLQTTGHILEWMAFSLPDADLTDPRVVKAVNFLTTLLENTDAKWEVGTKGHGIHALSLYDQRVFAPFDSASPLATSPAPIDRAPSAKLDVSRIGGRNDSSNSSEDGRQSTSPRPLFRRR
jgi:hypothetical protein